jgi:hypothetical protein
VVAHLARLADGVDLPRTDWAFLLDAALMHHTAWTKGKWEFLSEVRMRSAKFGATPEDSARLKLKVDDPSAAVRAPAQRVLTG